jgi:hypothetical protein
MSFTKDQINAVNLRSGRFDMTRIPRLRTDFTAADNVLNPAALNALNAQCNEHSERCEDLWIELDCQLLDAIEAEKQRKRHGIRKPKKVDLDEALDDCPADLLSEIKTDLDIL